LPIEKRWAIEATHIGTKEVTSVLWQVMLDGSRISCIMLSVTPIPLGVGGFISEDSLKLRM
jgi:hypothetical protein